MTSFMVFTITVGYKLFAAESTSELFFSSVNSHVLQQAALMLKVFLATSEDAFELAFAWVLLVVWVLNVEFVHVFNILDIYLWTLNLASIIWCYRIQSRNVLVVLLWFWDMDFLTFFTFQAHAIHWVILWATTALEILQHFN